MLKNFYSALGFILINSILFSQSSDDLVPKDAVSVISINNTSLLKKISMDSLIQYEFMEEVQSEMFDGSADNKTLKDAGIDFNQKMNVFYGKNDLYEVSGFSFGVSKLSDLLVVFDDFEKVKSSIAGVSYYNSYFNHLFIKNNSALVLRVDPAFEKVKKIADSIWAARGNGYVVDFQEKDKKNPF